MPVCPITSESAFSPCAWRLYSVWQRITCRWSPSTAHVSVAKAENRIRFFAFRDLPR